MNQYLSSARLKSISREQLLGKYGMAISAELAAGMILFVASLLCSAFMDQTSTAGVIISYIISFILDILSGIFLLGLTRFYLNLVCSQPSRISDIFYGFRSHADRAIAVRFFLAVMESLCLIPFFICLFLYISQESPVMFLLMSFTGVLGSIGSIYISLLYSQAYYVMLDFPSYSVRQVMSTSRRIIKGHKGRLFYISVTFIPYYLLSLLSCGIALLWVIPYRKTVFTNFYLDLMKL